MTESDSFPRVVSLRGEIVNRAAIQTQIQGKGERGQQGLPVSAYIQFKIKPLPPSLDCLRSAPFTLFLFSTSPLNIVGIAPLQKRPDDARILCTSLKKKKFREETREGRIKSAQDPLKSWRH